MATVFPDADMPALAAAVAQLPGATVVGTQIGAPFSRIRLRVAGADLAAAASALAAIRSSATSTPGSTRTCATSATPRATPAAAWSRPGSTTW